MHWLSGSKPLRSLGRIGQALKMVENGGILTTNHNLKYYKILLSPLVAKTQQNPTFLGVILAF